MSNFFEQMKDYQVENDNVSITENGAVGFRTTGKKLVDLNFAVSSLRSASEEDIYSRFCEAFVECPELAVRWLFFARDVRGGMGERRLFRVVLSRLASTNVELVKKLIPYVAEYGRYDDLFCLIDGSGSVVEKETLDYIYEQLDKDATNYASKKSISLLAKWLPSVSTSSKSSCELARKIAKHCGLTERQYRKSLSALRKYLDVTEVKMSANDWGEIRYDAVPSKANLLYNDAFLKHDEQRRREFLDKANKGEVKVNASTLYPHEIVDRYLSMGGWSCNINAFDQNLEAAWKNLKDTFSSDKRVIVIGDGSGSMFGKQGGVNPIAVSYALSIYFAERLQGEFANKYIIFSSNPHLVNISPNLSLRDKIAVTAKNSDCSNTDIEKTFNLILNTAVQKHLKQEEIPEIALVISDMEFDSATGNYYGYGRRTPNKALFDNIRDKFNAYGYKMPKLVFWNICSRTETIPVKENELGVALVSGFSPNICKMVLSNKLDPFAVLEETLMDKRYDPVGEVVKEVIGK